MRSRMLLGWAELRHGAAIPGDHEQRVVAEALRAARHLADLAADLALEELHATVGRRERRDAHESRTALGHAVEQREQPGIALLRGRVLAEESAAADARGAGERVDLEPRIIGAGPQPGRHG